MGREHLEPPVDPRRRILPEAEMIEVLLLAGWAFEVGAGRRAAAEAATREALESWIARGLGHRSGPSGERLFDPVEVVNFVKWLGLRGEDGFWADRYVATGRALVEALAAVPPDTRFEVSFERTFDLSRFPSGARLRLRAPAPLRTANREVAIEPQLGPDLGAELLLRDDHIEARCLSPAGGFASIGLRAAFAPAADPDGSAPLTPEERALYLRPAEGLIQVTPRVRALAARLAGEDGAPGEAVAAFWRHLLDELICGAIRYGDLEGGAAVHWVLDHGWYDCQLGSALLVSLCRARGVPARLVGGHVLYRLAPTNHFWAEIWFEGEGWRAYDLLSWDLSAGGRDAAWRDRFAGRLDARLVTQRLPLAFTGPMSVRFPAAWQMTQTRCGDGIAVTYRNAEDGELIFRDTISVNMEDRPAPSSTVGRG